METKQKFDWSWLAGLPFGLLYGVVARLWFGLEYPQSQAWEDAFATMSVAFVFAVPLAVGALTVWFSTPERRTSWSHAIGMSLAAVGVGCLAAGLFLVEALVCIVMALPVMLVMGLLGGVITCAVFRNRADKNNTGIMGTLVILPYLFAPIEAQFAVQDVHAVVESQIEINADADTVWQQIIRVGPIVDSERSFSPVFDWIGAPQPLEATLVQESVGGVRIGKFEHGLQFIETISDWQPGKRIEWAIQSDISRVDAMPWGEIGGKYFDVTAASYWIEPVGDDRVILHLNSTHRLSTHLNAYGLLWTTWGLGEFQNQVLQVVKGRAEHVQSP